MYIILRIVLIICSIYASSSTTAYYNTENNIITLHPSISDHPHNELQINSYFTWINILPVQTNGTITTIHLTTNNPTSTNHRIIDIQLFIGYKHDTIFNNIKISFNITKNIIQHNIHWTIQYHNPSLPYKHPQCYFQIFAVAYKQNPDRRTEGYKPYDKIPIDRTPTCQIPIIERSVHKNINISKPIDNTSLLQLPEIIEWDYWNYKSVAGETQLITNAVNTISLINKNNIVIDRIYLCYQQQNGDYKIIPNLSFKSATPKRTWTVNQKYLSMDNVSIRAIGYQMSLQQWVACSRRIVMHDFSASIPDNKLSMYFGPIDINDANIPVRFEWNKNKFKVDLKKRSYQFAIQFNNEQTVSEADLLSKQHPNLFFLLGFKRVNTWTVTPNDANFIKKHCKTKMRYNNAELDWNYQPIRSSVVKIFAYDADQQMFIGCTTKWDLMLGINGIDANILREDLFNVDSPDSPDGVVDDYMPVPGYQVVRNVSGSDRDDVSRSMRNRSVPTAPRRLPLKIVTLICVAVAMLILGIILVGISVQKKLHEQKLEQQIEHVNGGRNILFDPRLDRYSITHRVV
eukprot:6531_1